MGMDWIDSFRLPLNDRRFKKKAWTSERAIVNPIDLLWSQLLPHQLAAATYKALLPLRQLFELDRAILRSLPNIEYCGATAPWQHTVLVDLYSSKSSTQCPGHGKASEINTSICFFAHKQVYERKQTRQRL